MRAHAERAGLRIIQGRIKKRGRIMFDTRLLYRISCIPFHWHCWEIISNSRCIVYSGPCTRDGH